MYYNTTNETAETLKQLVERNGNQTDRVLLIMLNNRSLSASQCHEKYLNEYKQLVPLTSIRRALTDLMNEGFVIKTSKKRIGLFGKNEYIYKIKDQ